MVSDIWLNLAQNMGVFWGLSPEFTVYLITFLLSVIIAIMITIKTENVMAGLLGFMGALAVFAFMDAFPLWIVAIPTVILMLTYYFVNSGDGG